MSKKDIRKLKELAIQEKEPYKKLKLIAEVLLSEEGCPWDREQTHHSIKKYLLEEAYEVMETIDKEDFEGLKEELGDLLYQVFFHGELARKSGKFSVDDIFLGIAEKLIRRHPHVFGDLDIKHSEDVLREWEKIKREEKEKKQKKKHLLSGLPIGLPSLFLAYRVQEKTSRVGFDWEDANGVMEKIKEELKELEEAISTKKKEDIESEIGDLLFTLVNLARHLGVEPEEALRKTVKKFINRFNYIEEKINQQGKDIRDATNEEMEKLWEEAKNKIGE